MEGIYIFHNNNMLGIIRLKNVQLSVSSYGILLLFIASSTIVIPTAEAIPAFAKKYTSPCSLCHSSWPKLNKVGWQFKVNGYQLPDGRDGSKAGKISPSFDMNLDIGNANPPLSFRFGGGIEVYSPQTATDGTDRAKNFACCSQANNLKLYLSGTVAADLAYFISYPLGDGAPEQAYIRFVNLLGQGKLGIDIGAFRTADFDAVASGREWFAEPDPAIYGNGGFTAGDQGQSAGHVDTGIRLFGNPGYGPFSYDIVYVTGAGASGTTGRSNGQSVSVMGKLSTGNFTGSLRYWDSESNEITFNRDAGSGFITHNFDGVGNFKPDPTNADESTQDIVLALKYETEKWQVEAVYDSNIFKVGPRTDGVVTYTMDDVKRTGMSLAGILRVSSTLALGVRFGSSTVDKYSYVLNGIPEEMPSAGAVIYEMKMEFTPVQNAKVSLQLTMDSSNEEARKTVDGLTYDLQNKLVLLWDWAI